MIFPKFKFYYVILLVSSFSCKVSKLESVKVEILKETTQSWNGDALPNYPKGQPKITVLKITILPKTRLPNHFHPVINSGILLKGKLKVVDVDDNVLCLNEGDVIVELVNKIHYGINETNKPAVIIVFYVGTEELPITIKEDK